jgi:hypothetical protein
VALIRCPGCDKGVSPRAASCPHCGEPINTEAIPKVRLNCPGCGGSGKGRWVGLLFGGWAKCELCRGKGVL